MPLSEMARASLYSLPDVDVGFKSSAAPAPSPHVSASVSASLLLFLGLYKYQGLCGGNDVTCGSIVSASSCSITPVVESSDPPSAVLLHQTKPGSFRPPWAFRTVVH